jgi:hypothetical protein
MRTFLDFGAEIGASAMLQSTMFVFKFGKLTENPDARFFFDWRR